MADFRSFAARAKEKVRAHVETRMRAYATTLVRELQSATPRVTGQAQASWLASVGTPEGHFFGPTGLTRSTRDLAHRPGQSVAVAASAALSGARIAAWKLGQPLVIYNALPYIVRLNEGYSRQVPAGFVEAALMRASAASRGQ